MWERLIVNVGKRNTSGLGQSAPLFELKGKWARIELSAYVASLSYVLGILLVGEQKLTAASPAILAVLFICFLAFLISVVIIQGRMGFAPSANTFGKPQHLVTAGIFQYSRNPIFAAFLLPLISLAILSVSAAAIATAVYMVVMNLTVLRTEERDLVKLFGQTYVDYASKVPRWLF